MAYTDGFRFLKSLSVRSHAAPLTIDTIAELFQDFYIQAESHIGTHFAALTTRLSREKSPAPSTSSRSGKGNSRSNSTIDNEDPSGEQQMLTASEITDKRKARKQLEFRRVAMEEAVERGVCERVYDRIYRHRSTDDRERDAKLRSKTAALSLVGVGLEELHVDIKASVNKEVTGDEREVQQKINDLLAPARESLQRMDDEQYPLGKMQHLKDAHKRIVETLSYLFPSSSSADEVLPTLIYTLITSPPEHLNVASNLHFIQLFRASDKVDGEAAYCLVNLEAAISFLETVDLSSLRTVEGSEGPVQEPRKPADVLGILMEDDKDAQLPGRQSLTASPKPAASGFGEKAAPTSNNNADPTSTDPDGQPSKAAYGHQRRLSNLIQLQAERLEAGRENFLNSADQAFDSINSTLENSMKFLFGRIKEQESEGIKSPLLTMPKTLDDARKLMTTPPPDEDDVLSTSGASSIAGDVASDPLSRSDGKLLEIVGGRRNLRDHSVDSTRSGGSAKKVAFIAAEEKPATTPADSVGSFVNSLNPLSRFGVPSFAKFGRSASGPLASPPVGYTKTLNDLPEKAASPMDGKAQSEVDLNSVEALAQLKKTKPPARKFLEAKDAKELKIGDIDELLRDYKRLAEAIREAITS